MGFAVFLALGMLAMLVCMLYTNKSYGIKIWKIAVSAVLLTMIGYLGAKLMYFVEAGKWDGRSFYGAVFLTPILIFPVAKILRIPYGALMDLCAPAECIMLALLKVKCKIDGCCFGRIIELGDVSFQFPSQIVELLTALVLMVILIMIIKRGHWRGSVFAWYVFLYGATRLVLNFFRETKPWIGSLPAGSFWSLIAIVLGALYLILFKAKRERQ